MGRVRDCLRTAGGRGGLRWPGTRPAAARTCAVVDVDNIAFSGGPFLAQEARRNVEATLDRLGPFDVGLAVVSRRTLLDAGLLPLLARHDLAWRLDPGGPDAADRELLDYAAHMVRSGGATTVVVASGDGCFASLARIAELVVVTPERHCGVALCLRPYRRTDPTSASGHRRQDAAA